MPPLLDPEHIVHAKKGFLRPYTEGQEAVKNLVVVGVKSKSDREAHIVALCVRTTKINKDPVKIEVTIDKNTSKVEDKVKFISCKCPSGASTDHCCKHAMATLIFLERHDEEDLESLSCTDLEQKWGEIKEVTMSQFDPIPLEKFCHISNQQPPYRRAVKEVTPELAAEFRALYIKDRPLSEAAVFLSCVRHRDEQECGQGEPITPIIQTIVAHALGNASFILQRAQDLGAELYSKCTLGQKKYFDQFVRISADEARTICELTQDQCGPLWEKYKFGRISGSICYQLYTYYSNPNPNWQKKMETTFESSFKGNKHTERGLMYENDARDCYRRSNAGWEVVHPGFLVNPQLPWLGYSADSLILEVGKLIRVWECKTPAAGNNNSAKTICSSLSYMGKINQGKLKERHHYYGQIQLGICC